MSQELAKGIIFAGILLVLIGVIAWFTHDKWHWVGRLPGDIRIEKEHFRVYIPITTMLLISLLLSVLIRIWRYFS